MKFQPLFLSLTKRLNQISMDELLSPDEIHKLLKESGSVGFRQPNDPFFKPLNTMLDRSYSKAGVYYYEEEDSCHKK